MTTERTMMRCPHTFECGHQVPVAVDRWLNQPAGDPLPCCPCCHRMVKPHTAATLDGDRLLLLEDDGWAPIPPPEPTTCWPVPMTLARWQDVMAGKGRRW